MYLKNIDFPNQIIDAIREDKLVVFAGAGASAGEPTSFPNFVDLANRIADGTGESAKEDACEVFLGALKARGVAVNDIAAHILSETGRMHNMLHEAIVDLFPSLDKVKIVTTNYDHMFEQVFEERGEKVPIYNSPALPLGDDIEGIVHIHGNIDDSKYMVVTDEDFGVAYLKEGYATRFLTRLFESYTVLFIGYSYKDVIMRYLTRAMYRDNSAHRYILTDDKKSDWDALGISAIYFPKGKYKKEIEGLNSLGNLVKRGLFDWKNIFTEIADTPPKALEFEKEIDYCLESIELSKVLADCVYGSGWLELLERKEVFSACFSGQKVATETDTIWANWLCSKFVGRDDNSLIRLFARHKRGFNKFFSEILLQKIVRDGSSVSDEYLKKYLTLSERYLVDAWIISLLIEMTHERRLDYSSLHLFEKLYSVSLEVGEGFGIQEERIEYSHSFIGEYQIVRNAWDLIKADILPQYASEVLFLVQKVIENVHNMYAEMGGASDDEEPWNMSMLVIEDYVKEHSKEPFHILAEAFLQAARALKDEEGLAVYLKHVLTSNSLLLRKIVLRAVRESGAFSNDEKIEIICTEDWVWSLEGREQVFLLTQESFVGASPERQNRLLDIIEKRPCNYKDDVAREYVVYNWCVWLRRVSPENQRIESIIKDILSKYNFSPRENPERIIQESEGTWNPNASPVSASEMLEMPKEKLATMLVDFKERDFEGPTRFGLLKTFSDCVESNTQWAMGMADYFYLHKISDEDSWKYLLQGVKSANQKIEEALSWCKNLAGMLDVIPDIKAVADFLWEALRNKEMGAHFKKYEKELFELSIRLWEKRDTAEPSSMRIIDKVFNTATGIVLISWVYMASFSADNNIPSCYKVKFEEALQLNSWEHEVAVCVLAGHFNFLCYRDRIWCTKHFEAMLAGVRKKDYISAWEGYVFFSGRVVKDLVDVQPQIFLKAVKHVKWLEGDIREAFLALFLALLIFAVETPNAKFIPELYKSATEDIRNEFVESIERSLRKLDTETKVNTWDSWLKQFLINRKSNKPTELADAECNALFMLLPELKFVFDEAVEILCKGKLPSDLEIMFWYELNGGGFASEHASSLAKLLIVLLNSQKDLDGGKHYVIQMADKLRGIDEGSKAELQEALLKHGINVL